MISLFALAAGSVLACSTENARYTLRTDPAITARFQAVERSRDWTSGVVFVLYLGVTGRTYWFLPFEGGTDDQQHFASTTDIGGPGWKLPSPDGGPRPLGEFDFVATNTSYLVIDSIPKRGEPAPAHILIPKLGEGLWHQSVMLNSRDSAPKQFFDVTGCDTRR